MRRVVAAHRVENDFSRQAGLILRLSSHGRYFYRVRIVLPAQLAGPCSIHTLGRRDVAAGVPGSLDRGLFAALSVRHALDACRAVLLNVFVLALA